MAFWEDTLRYLYLPRLRDRGVLQQAIVKGAATRDFFGTAYGQAGDKFEGFKFGDANMQFDDTLLLDRARSRESIRGSASDKARPFSAPAISGHRRHRDSRRKPNSDTAHSLNGKGEPG